MSEAGEGRDPRAAFRAFVRANHPDVGGDPDEFIAGLARHRGEIAPSTGHEDRFDAPITFVRHAKGLTGRIRRWRQRKRRPPRVH
ncbi:hypothetical protein [Amycolatopsis anabasis]|uniref:hypothetical protein n=1 Tax=Amycolatopsis anabasis TaxID=1840409 RepID=UPI00131E58D1|nr:hypothetical protein [Amycolatopsis anabasis]